MGDTTTTPPQLEMSTAVSDTNRGIIITIVCWLCLVTTLIFYGARLQTRWPLKSLFGHDDAACTIATAFAVIQTALIMFSADHGLGTKQKKLSDDPIERVQKLIWTSDLFYVLALCLSKLAVACLLRRFSAAPARIRVFKVFMIAIVIYGVAGLVMTALRQTISEPWRYDERTSRSILQRWAAFAIMGVVLDVVALISPIYLVWNVDMVWRTKATVMFAFGCRAPTIAFTILRLIAISNVNSDDFTWSYVTPEVNTQLEMHYSLIAATIPCLRVFLKAWNTSFLAMTLEDMDERAFAQHATAKGIHAVDSSGNSKDDGRVNENSSPRRSSVRSNTGPEPRVSEKSYGISQTTVRDGRQDGDAASEKSQRAIVMKPIVDLLVD